MAGRRRLYVEPWYKKLEETFTKALEVRLALDELPTTAEQFVHAILPQDLHNEYTIALVEIVLAVDRRRDANHSRI